MKLFEAPWIGPIGGCGGAWELSSLFLNVPHGKSFCVKVLVALHLHPCPECSVVSNRAQASLPVSTSK